MEGPLLSLAPLLGLCPLPLVWGQGSLTQPRELLTCLSLGLAFPWGGVQRPATAQRSGFLVWSRSQAPK